MVEAIRSSLRDSKATRWTALVLVALSMLAAYFFVDAIAPLEALVEKNLNWTPDHYGFFSGSEYWLNVFGFLILSGIILDKMGIRFTGLLATVVMVGGSLVKLYALTPYFNQGGFGYAFFNSFWTSMPASAKLAALGYGIFGIGVEMCGITVSRAIVKWFKGKEMALAMGMEMATARMGAFVAFAFSTRLAKFEMVNGIPQGNPLTPVYFGVALLCIGFLTFLVYTFMDTKLDAQEGTGAAGSSEEEAFRLSDIGKILTNRGFLLISLLCVLFYCGVFPFLKFAPRMFQTKLGLDPKTAGLIPSLLPFGTIFLTPIFGYVLDTKGHGAKLMIFGAALLSAAHFSFAVAPPSMAVSIIAVVLLGVAFSLVPASMWPSVPKIVEERYLGSAYALVFWIQNIGLGLTPWLIGKVLVATNQGVAERIAAGDTTAVYNFKVPMLIFSGLSACAMVLGWLLLKEDKAKGYGLEKPNKEPQEHPAPMISE